MKIIATRKEDILRRKAEYDAQRAAYESDHEERWSRYRTAERDVLDPIQEYLKTELGKFDLLIFRIVVDTEFGGIEVRIQCDCDSLFKASSALSWHYTVNLSEEGELEQESGSWSGLQAVTAEQMESLKQTVQALEFINSIDWKQLLTVELPDYDKYMEGMTKNPEFHDFNKELQEAEIEDVIGQNILVKVGGISEYGRTPVWARFIKETPTQYQIEIIDDWTKKRLEESGELKPGVGFKRNIRKDKIFLIDPVETFVL